MSYDYLNKAGLQRYHNGIKAVLDTTARVGDDLSSPTTAFVSTESIVNGAVTMAKLDISGLLNFFYPVGSYYETSDATFNPNTAWGGVWVEDTSGRVLVAQDSETFTTIGATGGEETHTLTTDEMPAHNHAWQGVNDGTTVVGQQGNYPFRIYQDKQNNWGGTRSNIQNTGGGQAHNNLQPYIVIKRWHRTA